MLKKLTKKLKKMENVVYLILGLLFVYLLLRFLRKRFAVLRTILGETSNFIKLYKLRGADDYGSGAFGAPRSNHRTHNGLDLYMQSGDPVKAPFDCRIVRQGLAYAGNNEYRLIEVEGVNKFKGYKAKLMYVQTIQLVLDSRQIFKQGSTVGWAQDISKKYQRNGKVMRNHIHFELRKDGNLINPEKYA